MNRRRNALGLYAAGLLLPATVWAAPVGTAVTYQGYLVDGAGTVTNDCDFEFALYDADSGGLRLAGPLSVSEHVEDGNFTIPLNFGTGVFDGSRALWLEISVCCPSSCTVELLSPRVELTPAPHALALPGFHTQETVSAPNVIGGLSENAVDPGVAGAAISGGGSSGFPNVITGSWGAIGGGDGNTAGPGVDATVAGGFNNAASGASAAIGGGRNHTATGDRSTVAGGDGNSVTATNAAVGGGAGNMAGGLNASVGGGWFNEAAGNDSTVGGGGQNSASGPGSAITGGDGNSASGDRSAVGGGGDNMANGSLSAVGGGSFNRADGDSSTVGGGSLNRASGLSSMVPGGRLNIAGGDYSFAAGRRARVRDAAGSGDADGDEGTFVWADSTDADLFSTGPDQFLIRASGGVGIGTNAPSEQLDVDGNIHASGTISSGASITIDGIANTINSSATIGMQTAGGRVGIGTGSPSGQLDIEGTGSTTDIHVNNAAAGEGDPTIRFQLDGTGIFSMGVDDSDGDKFKIGTGAPQTNTRLTIDSNGKVGIGTGSPTAQLHILELSGDGIKVEGGAGGVNPSIRLEEVGGTGATMRLNESNSNALEFRMGGSTQMAIHQDGNVGIGSNAPSYPLHVSTGVSSRAIFGENTKTSGLTLGVKGESQSSANGSAGVFGSATASSGGTFGVWGEGASTGGRGVLGSATATSGFSFGVWGESASTGGTGVYGFTSAATGTTEGVRGETLSGGGTGVYGLANATSGVTYGVQGVNSSTSGRGVLGSATATSGENYGVLGVSFSLDGYDFYAGGVGTDYGSPSSIRWKRNVQTIDRPLEKVGRLRGVYFDWDEEHGGHHSVGMIAEEVGKVLPEIVKYEENGVDANGMDYSKLTPLLVEAVKALDARVERLEAELHSASSTSAKVRAGLPLLIVGLIGLAALRRRSAKGGA